MAKILLADDDPDMQEICTRFLSPRGYEIILAKDAAAAVSAAEQHLPNLILMDNKMPEWEGGPVNFEAGMNATRRIRATASLAHIPIVALTGHSMLKFKEIVLAAGCCEILTKPLDDLSLLLEVVKRYCNNQAAR